MCPICGIERQISHGVASAGYPSHHHVLVCTPSHTASDVITQQMSQHLTRQHHHVLVCTSSHTASDVITQQLSQHLTRQQLFRLYGSDRPLATVPEEVLKDWYQCEDVRLALGKWWWSFKSLIAPARMHTCCAMSAWPINQQLRIRRQCYESYIRKCCEGTNLNVQINGVQRAGSPLYTIIHWWSRPGHGTRNTYPAVPCHGPDWCASQNGNCPGIRRGPRCSDSIDHGWNNCCYSRSVA